MPFTGTRSTVCAVFHKYTTPSLMSLIYRVNFPDPHSLAVLPSILQTLTPPAGLVQILHDARTHHTDTHTNTHARTHTSTHIHTHTQSAAEGTSEMSHTLIYTHTHTNTHTVLARGQQRMQTGHKTSTMPEYDLNRAKTAKIFEKWPFLHSINIHNSRISFSRGLLPGAFRSFFHIRHQSHMNLHWNNRSSFVEWFRKYTFFPKTIRTQPFATLNLLRWRFEHRLACSYKAIRKDSRTVLHEP